MLSAQVLFAIGSQNKKSPHGGGKRANIAIKLSNKNIRENHETSMQTYSRRKRMGRRRRANRLWGKASAVNTCSKPKGEGPHVPEEEKKQVK